MLDPIVFTNQEGIDPEKFFIATYLMTFPTTDAYKTVEHAKDHADYDEIVVVGCLGPSVVLYLLFAPSFVYVIARRVHRCVQKPNETNPYDQVPVPGSQVYRFVSIFHNSPQHFLPTFLGLFIKEKYDGKNKQTVQDAKF